MASGARAEHPGRFNNHLAMHVLYAAIWIGAAAFLTWASIR
jgi:hypothetical protein